MAGRRMSYDERHGQLLDTAAAVVRADGADALTLARVAEQAGVTKPIVYGHFETRAGLVKALYQRVDEQQSEAVRVALDTKVRTLEEAAALLAEAYVGCVLHIGQEYGAITAALSSSPDMEEVLHAGRERYVDLYLEALHRFVPGKLDRAVVFGVIGAAESLSREAIAGRLPGPRAIDAVGRIILAVVRDS
ncbi:TetR/AcrR family transcriptional regulator [Amycolatopsis sp. NPDC001319]|uniref:TetR/AcrR family transcriptional regulator n=1 Tax=unclassified Amycolatopsis TaxID=2618356 RepID=UPI00368A7C93